MNDEAVTAGEPTGPAANAGVLAGVVDLLLRPAAFFARQPRVRGKATLGIVVVLGLQIAFYRPDKIGRITTAEGFTRFLGSLLFALFVAGPLYWWLGGLWCLARIRWSGEPAVDRDRASMIFGVSEMVTAVPVVVWAAIDLALSPMRPWMSPTLILATAWSQFVSYQAVRATFPFVSPWRARVWFLIVPGLVYAAVIWRAFYAV